jgi:hypothetical protein
MIYMQPTHHNARGPVMSVQGICSCHVYFCMVHELNTVANRTAVINISQSFLIYLLKSDNNLEIHKKVSGRRFHYRWQDNIKDVC